MKRHPALSMLYLWALCALAFYALPFQLVGRELTGWGFLILALFILSFCMGGMVQTLGARVRAAAVKDVEPPKPIGYDFRVADAVMMIASMVATVALASDIFQNNLLDLGRAWLSRNERATDLLTGEASSSSTLFQVAFLIYPVGFIFIAREIVFAARPNLVRLAVFGGLPILMISIATGGRNPIFYAMALAFIAYRIRGRMQPKPKRAKPPLTPRAILLFTLSGLAALVALNYFIQVFVARTEGIGGIEAMFDSVGSLWGVTFSGPTAEFLFATIGYGNSFLVFVFIWYLVQGLVISNVLFSQYDGPPHFGVYGIELVTASMRRIDSDFVSDRFFSLLDLNVFGFLPSSFGSLYVDFGYVGIPLTFAWGYFAAVVYHRTQARSDPRWFLVAPFISLGIFFSLSNTPIGFGNGLVTHLWLAIVILLTRVAPIAAPRLSPGLAHR